MRLSLWKCAFCQQAQRFLVTRNWTITWSFICLIFYLGGAGTVFIFERIFTNLQSFASLGYQWSLLVNFVQRTAPHLNSNLIGCWRLYREFLFWSAIKNAAFLKTLHRLNYFIEEIYTRHFMLYSLIKGWPDYLSADLGYLWRVQIFAPFKNKTNIRTWHR